MGNTIAVFLFGFLISVAGMTIGLFIANWLDEKNL